MAQLKLRTVLTLPGTPEASTMYMLKSAESPFMEIYVSNSDGSELRHIINKTEVQSLISAAVNAINNILVVNNIAARNALTPTSNVLVLVIDATGDGTVSSGAALYVYRLSATTWIKVSEFESLDVSLLWANIQNKPTSIVADIDDAVTKRHTHSNISVLNLLSVDGGGQLNYNSQPVRAPLEEQAW